MLNPGIKLLFVTGMLLTMGLGSIQAHAEPILIRFSHIVSPDTPKGQGALMFQKLVNERLGEQVRVEVYPKASLYNEDEEVQALQEGRVELIAPSLSNFSKLSPPLQIFDLPFLFEDLDAVERFQKKPAGRRLLLSMADKNLVGLGYWHNGMKQLLAQKPLDTPKNASGLTFRIQDSPLIKAQFESVNAKALYMPFSEVTAALSSGMVDGTETSWSNIYNHDIYKFQPYITESNHGVLDYMLVTNATFWRHLPFSIRSELESILIEVTYQVNQLALELANKNRAKIVATGVSKIIQLTPEQRLKWRQAMHPVWKRFEDQIGSELIEYADRTNKR